MLPQEIRNKKVIFKTEHILQRLKERGYLFPFDSSAKSNWRECVEAIKNPLKGIFFEDEREEVQSNYVCMFVGDSGKKIALPCYINEEIALLTIKDVEKDGSNPNWFIRKYNEIAEKRNMNKLNLIFK